MLVLPCKVDKMVENINQLITILKCEFSCGRAPCLSLALAHAVSHCLLNAYARLASTVVHVQFLVDRTQFIFALFNFSPVSYHSITLTYLFICGLVDAQSAD